ncbi:MAG: phosphonate C-P lyase system protein PhnG [Clostridiales Family XIII bacterium]|jgi:alpha-D-ribose 1-methylphosphonate 5-triphosphate synthase subunit PhnG|nr:phosphonate C-P lyase system protein PhnG [Clostridiales Family XIII bacterium]
MHDCKERTRLLIRCGNGEALQMANEITEKYPIEWISRPQEGLAMIKVRETAGQTLFCLGEVLITEAKARIGGHIGLGVVTGSRPALCEALAVVDAACRAELPETNRWDAYWARILERENTQDKMWLAIREKTKVDFRTMKE